MSRINFALAMVLTVLFGYSQTLTELQVLRGSDTPNGSGNTDRFGREVAISGNTLAVAAPFHNGGRGAVYVFELNGSNQWVEVAKLTSSDAAVDRRFGTSLAIEGDVILVGNDIADHANQGAYIFEKPVSGWTNMTETIKLNTPAPPNSVSTSGFGISLDINGSEILVGAPFEDVGSTIQSGRIYIYEKSGASWTTAFLRAELTSTNVGYGAMGLAAAFGDNFIVAGAPVTGSSAGTLHIFERPVSGTWANATVEDILLLASDRSSGDSFGTEISVSGDLIVTSGGSDGVSNSVNGYVFERESALWSNQSTQTEQILEPLPAHMPFAFYLLAYQTISIETQERIAFFGNGSSTGLTQGNNSPVGSVLIKDFKSGATISETDGFSYAPNGLFGTAIAVEGSKVIISSPQETQGGVVRYFDFSYNESVNQSICPGEAILFGSQSITQPGIYTEQFIATNGLDSLVELTISGPLEPSASSVTAAYETFNTNGLIISRDANDQVSTHYIITNIQGGLLFLNDENTQLFNGDYVQISDGLDGLKFKPNQPGNGSFEIQASIGTDGSCLSEVNSIIIDGGKAPLLVTANDITITEDDLLPPLTFQYDGFVNNEDEGILDSEPTISTNAVEGNPGTYSITLTGGADDNYDIQLIDGTLVITEVLSAFEQKDFRIYPNPTSDVLKIDLNPDQIKAVRLLDMEGHVLFVKASKIFEISDLSQGVYILEIEDQHGKKTSHRVIKQ